MEKKQSLSFEQIWILRKNSFIPTLPRGKIFLLDIAVAQQAHFCPGCSTRLSILIFVPATYIYLWRQNLRFEQKNWIIWIFSQFSVSRSSNPPTYCVIDFPTAHTSKYLLSIENHHSREKSAPRDLPELSPARVSDVSDAIGIQYLSVIKLFDFIGIQFFFR